MFTGNCRKITQNCNAESSFAIMNEQAVLLSYVSCLLLVYTQPRQMDHTAPRHLFFMNEGSALSELVTLPSNIACSFILVKDHLL